MMIRHTGGEDRTEWLRMRRALRSRHQGLTELASDAELANTGVISAHEALGFKEMFRLVHYLKEIRR